ncbi:hypothetical protein Syn6312_0510 [Synechococcus sp. PCC 6312]|nr:hypothetical protein Syn6312_0510 [Synechococcus sp. PCC 6312]
MIANPLPSPYSPEEYLAFEAASETKHEYCQGEIYAMAGASRIHVLITVNLVTLFRQQLRGQPCLPYSNDLKVNVPAAGAYFYPDLVVSCDPRDSRTTDDILNHPRLVLEVLSPTTETFDRGRKFQAYQTIPSLEYYLLVSQTEMHLDVYQRQGINQWLLTPLGASDQLILPSLNFTCAIADIYEDVPAFVSPPEGLPERTG